MKTLQHFCNNTNAKTPAVEQEAGYTQGNPGLLAEIREHIHSARYAVPKAVIEQELETQVEE